MHMHLKFKVLDLIVWLQCEGNWKAEWGEGISCSLPRF